MLRPLAAFLAQQAVEGEFHCLGGEGFAILEGHALPQGEADALALVQFFPGFGQTGDQFHVGAAIGQAFKDIGRDRGPVDQKRVDRVPATRILRG